MHTLPVSSGQGPGVAGRTVGLVVDQAARRARAARRAAAESELLATVAGSVLRGSLRRCQRQGDQRSGARCG